MTWIKFNEVVLWGYKSGKCGCGKRRQRRQKFCQTINPYNQNVQGVPKTREEIRVELRAQIAEWERVPITCAACSLGREVDHEQR